MHQLPITAERSFKLPEAIVKREMTERRLALIAAGLNIPTPESSSMEQAFYRAKISLWTVILEEAYDNPDQEPCLQKAFDESAKGLSADVMDILRKNGVLVSEREVEGIVEVLHGLRAAESSNTEEITLGLLGYVPEVADEHGVTESEVFVNDLLYESLVQKSVSPEGFAKRLIEDFDSLSRERILALNLQYYGLQLRGSGVDPSEIDEKVLEWQSAEDFDDKIDEVMRNLNSLKVKLCRAQLIRFWGIDVFNMLPPDLAARLAEEQEIPNSSNNA